MKLRMLKRVADLVKPPLRKNSSQIVSLNGIATNRQALVPPDAVGSRLFVNPDYSPRRFFGIRSQLSVNLELLRSDS